MTRPGRESIITHFHPHDELEAALEARGKTYLLDSVCTMQPDLRVQCTAEFDYRTLK